MSLRPAWSIELDLISPKKVSGFLVIVVLLVEKLVEELIRSCVIRGHVLAGYFGSMV